MIKRRGLYIILLISLLTIFSSSVLTVSAKGVREVEGIYYKGERPFLKNIIYTMDKKEFEVKFYFDSDIEYKDFFLKTPPRFVIDIKGGQYNWPYRKIEPHDPLIKELRIFHNSRGLRIVAEFNYRGPWQELDWDAENKILTMTVHRQFTEKDSVSLEKGIDYYQIREGLAKGPVSMQAIIAEPASHIKGRKMLEAIGKMEPGPDLLVETAYKNYPKGKLNGLSKLSDLNIQENGIAAINGGFYAYYGVPLGLIIKNGQLVSPPIYGRTAFGVDKDGKMYIDRVDLEATLYIKGRKYDLTGFNRPRHADDLVLYAPSYSSTTETNEWGLEAVINDGRVTAINKGNTTIPDDGWVLSAHGKYKSVIENLEVGDKLYLSMHLTPDWLQKGIVEGLGGGPRLVKDGRVHITGKEEKFQPDVLYSRAPRTAVGITEDNRLIMLVVDGRSRYSIGMTLEELANTMIELGAVQAMNLDGGASSTLVIGDKVYNEPSAGERLIHNGLIIKFNQD